MTVQESFVKALVENMKTAPVLKCSNETLVRIRVSAIIGICKRFHAAGWKDSDVLGGLATMFEKFR
jgi:hypothetical protein